MTPKEAFQTAQRAREFTYKRNLLECCLAIIELKAEKGYFNWTFSYFDKYFPSSVYPVKLDSTMKELSEKGFTVTKVNEMTLDVSWEQIEIK